LIKRSKAWTLEEAGREICRWPTLRSALETTWARRRRRGSSPWAVGWIGYEEAAELAGGLPVCRGDDPEPTSRFLLEPEAVPAVSDSRGPEVGGRGAFRWSLDGDRYREGVSSIRARIAAGDVYQVNLCRRLTVEEEDVSLSTFAAAAAEGGMPGYLARFHFADAELLCASMELLLRKRGNVLETHPIKGTRPRSTDPAEDSRLAQELTTDPKERAELAMVIDLERNDLGRVSEIGSVEVVDTGSVHSYATVHHLVGRVRARARTGLEWWELLASIAPGGSVTGCPKHAAMSVIKQLEPVRRGPFCGALGVVAGDGDIELALPIRTAWRAGSRLEFAAGCGIVWESKPEAEERESRLKVTRWLDLVGSAV
jgi:para-aminobenzoate synthetase component 1